MTGPESDRLTALQNGPVSMTGPFFYARQTLWQAGNVRYVWFSGWILLPCHMAMIGMTGRCGATSLRWFVFRQGRQLNWISRNDWLKPVATVRLPSLPAEGSERKLGAYRNHRIRLTDSLVSLAAA